MDGCRRVKLWTECTPHDTKKALVTEFTLPSIVAISADPASHVIQPPLRLTTSCPGQRGDGGGG